MLRYFILFLCIYLSQSLFTQDYTQFWLRTTIQYKLNKKLSSSIEWHHRTQSLTNTENPFRFPLTNAFRIWVNYKLSDRESINFNPYAFFSNHPQMLLESYISKSNANEHRIHLQYENREQLHSRFMLGHRFGIEYRIFEGQSNLLRTRLRESIQFSISKRVNMQLYDELFLNTINVTKNHIFDQNRLGIITQFRIDSRFGLELGTTLIQVMPRTGSTYNTLYMFQTNLNYRIGKF